MTIFDGVERVSAGNADDMIDKITESIMADVSERGLEWSDEDSEKMKDVRRSLSTVDGWIFGRLDYEFDFRFGVFGLGVKMLCIGKDGNFHRLPVAPVIHCDKNGVPFVMMQFDDGTEKRIEENDIESINVSTAVVVFTQQITPPGVLKRK